MPGVPIPNDKQHAAEIARLAIHIIDNMYTLEIPHMSCTNFKIRIGINSGRSRQTDTEFHAKTLISHFVCVSLIVSAKRVCLTKDQTFVFVIGLSCAV